MSEKKVATSSQSLNPPLLPSDPLGVQFCQYFNHPWNFISAPVPQPGEPVQWTTETRYPLMPRNLWQNYQNPAIILGLRFGSKTRYLMLDIDRGSQYHPEKDSKKFRSILWTIEDIGLCRSLAIQSSDSGGLHVYFFLPEPVESFGLAVAVKYALKDAGLYLQPGQIESFPNVKLYNPAKVTNYNAHRLPLQSGTGSIRLDRDFAPINDDLKRFLDLADMDAAGQDMESLHDAIACAKQRHKKERYGPVLSGNAKKWKQDLEASINQGWTGTGQTNDLLQQFVCYGKVWLGLSDEALVDYVVNTALNAPGYTQYCRHQHEIRDRAAQRVYSTESNQFYTSYCSIPPRKATYGETYRSDNNSTSEAANNVVPFSTNPTNEQRSTMALERVQQAIAHLEINGPLPTSVGARILAIISTVKELTGVRISNSTLYKKNYLPLWHPQCHEQGCGNNVEKAFLATSNPATIAEANSLENFIKTPEPLPGLNFEENYAPPPYMKVARGLLAPGAIPDHPGLALLDAEASDMENFGFVELVENVEKAIANLNSADNLSETLSETFSSLNAKAIANLNFVDNLSETLSEAIFDFNEKAIANLNSADNLSETLSEAILETISETTRETIQFLTTQPNSDLTDITVKFEDNSESNFIDLVSSSEMTLQFTIEPVVDVGLLKLITRIRFEAKVKAQTEISAIAANLFFSREQRERFETFIKMQLLWKSGQPLLIAEVEAWANATEGVVMTSSGLILITEINTDREDFPSFSAPEPPTFVSELTWLTQILDVNLHSDSAPKDDEADDQDNRASQVEASDQQEQSNQYGNPWDELETELLNEATVTYREIPYEEIERKMALIEQEYYQEYYITPLEEEDF